MIVSRLDEYRRRICRVLVAMASLCVVGLWVFETETQVITELDRIAYPLLLAAFVVSLFLMLALPRWHRMAEWIAYLSFTTYCLVGVAAFGHLAEQTRLYTIANTLQWMPMLYVASFILLQRRDAVIAAALVFLSMSIPIVVEFSASDSYLKDRVLGSLVINAYLVHLVILVSLSLFVMTSLAFEQARAKAKALETMASTDSLTGTMNRRGLEQILRHVAGGSSGEIGLILIDIDNFKPINDTYGHLAGDAVLQAVAKRLAGVVRDSDVVGRWGGDEFLIITRDAQLTDVIAMADRARQHVGTHVLAGMRVTLSAGVGVWDGQGPWADALQRIDRALYSAKAKGRNRTAEAATAPNPIPA